MNFLCTKNKETADKLKKAGYKLIRSDTINSIYLFENNPAVTFDKKRYKGVVFTNTFIL